MPHNHSAHCSDDAHDDDHDHDHESETGPADNLYPYIDIQHVVALNASDETSPSSVIKPWDKRLDESTVLSLHLLLSLPSISLLLLSCRLVCRERCGRPAVRLLFLFPFKGANVFFYRIFRIPFTGSVKLRSVLLKSGPGDQTPSKLALVGISRITPRSFVALITFPQVRKRGQCRFL